MRIVLVIAFALVALPPATVAPKPPGCSERAEAVRAMGTGKGLPPLDAKVAEQGWLAGLTSAIAPRVEADYHDDIDSVSAVVEVAASGDVVFAPVHTPSEKLGRDRVRLRVELLKLPKGDRVAIAAGETLPASLLRDVLSQVPAGVEPGLIVRKPGAVVARTHQKTFPFSPHDLEAIFAASFDQVGAVIMIPTADAYRAELDRVVSSCPQAREAFVKTSQGSGLDVTFSALANAALVCGCDRLDLDRAVSMMLFWTSVSTRTHGFLPLPREGERAGKQDTVADFAHAVTKRKASK